MLVSRISRRCSLSNLAMRAATMFRSWILALATFLASTLAGCGFMVGPDYEPPMPPLAEQYREPTGTEVTAGTTEHRDWWKLFADPSLDTLVDRAYRGNRTLRAAGLRVLEAQASRGIAVGNLYPQRQDAFGSLTYFETSRRAANSAPNRRFHDWSTGFDAAWELDLWGKFRRGIEVADAELLASVASYDDVLVTLIAEVAFNYTQYRTLEEQLVVARDNLEIQQRSYDIADARYRDGAASGLDSAQARSLLESTRSTIPRFEAALRQTEHVLCVLLGIPPTELAELRSDLRSIPHAPPTVVVGIPAELLRRRPDIRFAERTLAAQSARIGIAKADFYPSLSLIGEIGVTASDASDLFASGSMAAFGGPSLRWKILNYGRVVNNVRVQDARYQANLNDYEDVVLRAQQEVESAIAGYLGAKREAAALADAVMAAERAVELALIQYREGATDYTTVINTQQVLVSQQNRYVATRGDEILNVLSLYKALGGGWELRDGNDFVSDETKAQLKGRTFWGNLLDDDTRADQIEDAAKDGVLPGWPARPSSWLPSW
jgi:NodT family efflux transporter outer membrane factor (OMF) lipoprotein